MSQAAVLNSDAQPDLRGRWAALKDENPGIRARDAAARLEVSEAALVASLVGDQGVRLNGDLAAVLRRMPEVGEVMCLTRNDACVHEKVGRFDHVDIKPGMGLVLNHDIDLRLFMGHWRHGFALTEPTKDGGVRRCIQVFDGEGVAVHKIYQREGTDVAAWDRIVAEFTDAEQTDAFEPTPYPVKPVDRADAEIDLEGLRANWAALQDTHDFFGMLRDYGVGRLQAFRMVGAPFARRIPNDSARRMLETAAEWGAPIMCFVGNRGCIQIHTGPVEKIKVMGPWLNVLDPGFNLHLREDRIDSAWVVRKPTRDGDVTSVELFDAEGNNFAIFFGERKPGEVEREDWRALVATLEAAA